MKEKEEKPPLSQNTAKREANFSDVDIHLKRRRTLKVQRSADWFEDALWTTWERIDAATFWKMHLGETPRPEFLPSNFLEWEYREGLNLTADRKPRVTLRQRVAHFYKEVFLSRPLDDKIEPWMLEGLRLALFAEVRAVERFMPGVAALHLRKAVTDLVALWDCSGAEFTDETTWREHVRETFDALEKTAAELCEAAAKHEAELIAEEEKRGRMAARELKAEIREKTRDAKLAAIDQTGKTILKETRQEKRRRKIAEGAMQIAPQYRGTENLKGLRRKQIRAVIDYVQENPIVENDKAGKDATDLTLKRTVEVVWAENEAKWKNGLGGYPTYEALAAACYRLDKSNREAFRYKG